MNVYEYELAGFADTIHDQPTCSNPDENEWDDDFTPGELAICENPF